MTDLYNKGFDGIITWLKDNHKGPVPQWKINYLTKLCLDENNNLRCKYINDYVLGTVITNRLTGESWKIEKSAGVTSYDSRFKTNYSPDVIIRMGIFGGLALKYIDTEVPIEWILYALVDDKIRPYNMFPERHINFYDTIAEPFLKDNKALDFFHWYVRYYLGKRCAEDTFFINKWNNYTSQLKQLMETDISYQYLIVRQILLQWGCKA
jgi:hypothetical protein